MSYFKDIKKDFIMQLQGRKKLNSMISACFFSRGFHLLISYRTQRFFLKIPVLGLIVAKILHYITSCLTSCEISFHAEIEGGVYIPHAIGIAIGENVKIKKGVSIYQNVTIGRKYKTDNSTPIISEGVYIGANSVIIGAIKIGEKAIIGANSVVTRNIPEKRTAVGAPARLTNI